MFRVPSVERKTPSNSGIRFVRSPENITGTRTIKSLGDGSSANAETASPRFNVISSQGKRTMSKSKGETREQKIKRLREEIARLNKSLAELPIGITSISASGQGGGMSQTIDRKSVLEERDKLQNELSRLLRGGYTRTIDMSDCW